MLCAIAAAMPIGCAESLRLSGRLLYFSQGCAFSGYAGKKVEAVKLPFFPFNLQSAAQPQREKGTRFREVRDFPHIKAAQPQRAEPLIKSIRNDSIILSAVSRASIKMLL
jgi:hypothetical protein